MKGDWSGWAQTPTSDVWHQVEDSRTYGYAWFPCLARQICVGDIMDYRWPPPKRCKHISCQNPVEP